MTESNNTHHCLWKQPLWETANYKSMRVNLWFFARKLSHIFQNHPHWFQNSFNVKLNIFILRKGAKHARRVTLILVCQNFLWKTNCKGIHTGSVYSLCHRPVQLRSFNWKIQVQIMANVFLILTMTENTHHIFAEMTNNFICQKKSFKNYGSSYLHQNCKTYNYMQKRRLNSVEKMKLRINK